METTVEKRIRVGLDRLMKIEVFVAVTALVSVAVALVLDVLAREVLGNGIFGSQRYAVFSNAVAGLLGFAIVVHLGGHLRISVIDNVFPKNWHDAMGRIADAVSAAICTYFAIYAVDFVKKTATIGDVDAVLGIEVWVVQLILPYIFVASALRYLAFASYPALRPVDKEF